MLKTIKIYNLAFLVMLLFCRNTKLIAQHCPWDGTGIMIFEIKAGKTDTLSINKLKLTLTDSLGNKLYGDWYSSRGKENFQLEVFQNLLQDDCERISRLELRKYKCYYFAQNHYVIVAGMGDLTTKNLILTIEDADGLENGGNFETITHKINPNMAFSLCTHYSNWNEGMGSGFKGFQTEIIILDKVID